jgi:RNA polymerase sigma factor (sigma-70 family)
VQTQNYHNLHQAVIDRCKSGERSAQYELYKLYSKAMLNTAYRIVQNTAEAEDILQESFISVFRNLDNYKGESSFGSWMKKIVVNQALSQVRKRKASWEEIDDEQQGLATEPAEEEDWMEQVTEVKDAINRLPEGYRVILSLYLLEGYDHTEIAGYLNITESTSKSQYLRAKQKLRNMLSSPGLRTYGR